MRPLLALLLRMYFRRIAVTGADRVPTIGPVIVVLNHPNSLVDPVFALAFAPRRPVFLAKEPLFHVPVIGWLTRLAGAIPVYRRQDAADMAQNRHTFERVWQELACGGVVALFPEGTSHSDPRMRPFKTGAARIALGAASQNSGLPVQLVPAGLYYTAKARFRSSALLSFGSPITVASESLGADDEPAAASVRALTVRLEQALADLTIQADEQAALDLVTRAERIYSSLEGAATNDRDLTVQFDRRLRLMRGYGELRRRAPERLARAEDLIALYDTELRSAGLSPENLLRSQLTVGAVIGNAAVAVGRLLLLAPFALPGIVIHFLPYQLLGVMVARINVEHDVRATAKILAASALFPIAWTVVAVIVGRRFGPAAGIAAWLLMPGLGYAALRFVEGLDRLIGATRGLSLRLLRPRAFSRLESQRRAIRSEIIALDALLETRG